MYNEARKGQAEQLNTQNNVNETSNNNYPLIEREKIEGTPFHIVGNEERGYRLTMGRYALTEPEKDKDKVMEYLESSKWIITAKMIAIMMEIDEEMRKNP